MSDGEAHAILNIRPGEPSDIDVLADIERETAAMFTPDTLPPVLAQPLPAAELWIAMRASLLWVAEIVSAGPVGFLLAETYGAALHIREMDVCPRFGRRGVGGSLLQHACQVAGLLRLGCLTLTTFRSVPWNAPFYAKHAFVPATNLHRFPHLQHALLYEAHLGLRNRVAMVRTLEHERSGHRG